MNFFRYLFCTVLFAATPVSAAVVISEIMYAPEEGVAHEWFEILNDGDAQVDLKEWRFSDGSNHVFEEPPKNGGQGSLIIPAGEYAVIAKEADTFLSSHSGFSGTVIDGSFSLTDTGDTLSLVDADGVVIDTATYGENAGAQKNGLSLQKISGVFTAATPTPGAANSNSGQESTSSQQESSSESSLSVTTSTTSLGSSFPVDPQIFASAGARTRTGVTGGDITFSGSVWGLKKEPIENARMLWNFGDGGTAEGKKVVHTYKYPGTYIVILDAASGFYSATDRVTVEGVPANISISSVGDTTSFFVELYNESLLELDISGWNIRTPSQTFIFPQNTFIAPGKKVRFSSDMTGFNFYTNNVSLHYPNGSKAITYEPKKVSSVANISSSVDQKKVAVSNEPSTSTIKKENPPILSHLVAPLSP